jgi:hypothetical protein
MSLNMNTEELNALKGFVTLWDSYCTRLPVNDIDFESYLKIINKLRNDDMVFSEIKEKQIFIVLIEIMSETIYNEETDFEKKKYCSGILNLLEEYAMREEENSYDKAFENKILEEKLYLKK